MSGAMDAVPEWMDGGHLAALVDVLRYVDKYVVTASESAQLASLLIDGHGWNDNEVTDLFGWGEDT